MEPLQIVPATPPVEATLRILLNSVPYLIGVAVLRQPAGPDAVVAEVGRNPWLFDRRLTALQLPDDTLPANRGVALDWPVPYQAEWVGVPPRLLISRLVSTDRTVGVLLGTLVTREQLNAQAREAIDLSCELIASAMSVAPAAVPASAAAAASAAESAPAIPDEALAGVQAVIREIGAAALAAEDARAIGRILRDAMNDVSEASAFAVALFHSDRPEVAYRYKVAGADAASSELGKQPVDDSPSCYAVRNAERLHAFDRSVNVGGERRRVAVLQVPLAEGGALIGVVTLQTFREGGFSAEGGPAGGEFGLIAAIVDATAPGFARARAAGRFQPTPPARAALPSVPPSTRPLPAAVEPAVAAPDDPAGAILQELLDRCALDGAPTGFIVGLDAAERVLRGDRISGSPAAAELDKALGIVGAHFTVSLDERDNAIARACREARVVLAPTVHELIHPAHDWTEALVVERLVGGGRSAVVPLLVGGAVVGALVVGPRFEDLDPATLERVRSHADDAGRRLGAAWNADEGADGARTFARRAVQVA